MRSTLQLLLAAMLLAMSSCHRQDARAVGERSLSVQEPVYFTPAPLSPGTRFLLSTNASHRLINTLRSDAIYVDDRDVPAAPYGTFEVAGRKFFLFYSFICDDPYLHGRAWHADWIDAGFQQLNTNAHPHTEATWQASLESWFPGSVTTNGLSK